jgi:D-tyrosyl-tRNA(Tyr) deacylase
VFLAISGCGESACEKAQGTGGTHACYVEIQKEKRDAQQDEYGSVRAAHEAEHAEQVEEEVGEVEEIVKERRAQEIANALEGR